MESVQPTPPSKHEERDYPHWNRIYLSVIIYTAVIIVALWEFSSFFTR